MTNYNWELFENQFDVSWHKWVKPIVTSQAFYESFQELKKRGKTAKVFPSSSSNNLFRVFREVKFEDVNVVIVGLSPYNTVVNGKEVADGLALSCSNTMEEQPSLKKWYDNMEKQYKNIVRDPDLSYLCKEGVMLYNYSLTAEEGNPTGHIGIWEYFSNTLFNTAISKLEVPVISLGKEADRIQQYVMPWQPYFNIEHPARASYMKRDWETNGVFPAVKLLMDQKNIPFSWVKYSKTDF